jgi:hypothetical protein
MLKYIGKSNKQYIEWKFIKLTFGNIKKQWKLINLNKYIK